MKRYPSFLHYFSLRQKMILGFLLVSLTGVFTIALSAHHYYTKATSKDFYTLANGASAGLNNQIDQYLNSMAESTYAMVAGSLQLSGDSLLHIPDSYIIQEWLAGSIERTAQNRLQIENLFKLHITLSYSEIESMVLISNTGEVVSSRGESDAAVYRQQRWQEQPPQPVPTLLQMKQSRLSRIPVVPLVVPIYNTKKVKIVGRLILNVSTTEIRKIMGGTPIGDTGYFFILDPGDHIVYHPDPALVGQSIAESRLSPFSRIRPDSILTVDKVKFLTTYSASDFTGWRIMAVVPLPEMASGLHVARNSIIMVMLFLLAFVFLIVPLLTRALLAPVMKLNKNMREVRRGDLNVTVDVLPSRDEFQMLGNNFAHMLTTLNELIDKVYRFQIREMNLELRQKDATIHALQNQINPHFLYNSLDIIKSIAFLEDVPKIERMVGNLAAFFRYTAKSDRIEVSLRDEIVHLNEYLEIIRIRFNDRHIGKNYIPEKYMDVRLVKLTVQPIVENAVKYAVEATHGEAEIIISAYDAQDDLFIEVVDNGPGIDEERMNLIREQLSASGDDYYESPTPGDKSVGLANVHARLKLQYGTPYGLSVVSFPGRGAAVTVRIPMQKKKNVQANIKM
ncbi:sensor histidine kinase [Cohnella cellulosilytica]|uniref:histidine kinase n=1 Tax=Cohnella cellulosilytica TaxID=986710 RepID=A0ABW2FFH2_9BACL